MLDERQSSDQMLEQIGARTIPEFDGVVAATV